MLNKGTLKFVAVLLLCAICMAASTVVNLATQVEGTLATTNGGTGVSGSATFPSAGTVYGINTNSLTPASTVTVDVTTNNFFTLVPAQAEAISASNCVSGKDVKLVIQTAGTTSFVLTFSTNFKSQGTITTGTSAGKIFAMHFVCSGTSLTELSRTTAM